MNHQPETEPRPWSVPIFLGILLVMFLPACTNDAADGDPAPQPTGPDIQNTLGFGILDRVKGIWNGPVTSSTPLGGYPEWIVDFRPISENQILAKNELDTLNDINMSFFVALYSGQYAMAFRNGGSFGGQQRISYFLADSVSETADGSFYRFREIVIGTERAYTEVVFRDDSLLMKVYTNHYNLQPSTTLHMAWNARLQDTTSCADAVEHFTFPKKTMTKDFTTTFNGVTEAVYYDLASDPYPESAQPYVGQTTVTYSYAGGFIPDPTKKVFLVITTQPLLVGLLPQPANLKYRSRYVILAANDPGFIFNHMHPGSYHLLALYDGDGNGTFSSGDRVSSTNAAFALGDQGTVNASAVIDFVIP